MKDTLTHLTAGTLLGLKKHVMKEDLCVTNFHFLIFYTILYRTLSHTV